MERYSPFFMDMFKYFFSAFLVLGGMFLGFGESANNKAELDIVSSGTQNKWHGVSDEVIFGREGDQKKSEEDIQKIDSACSVPASVPSELEDLFAEAIQDIPCHLLQSLYRVEIFEDPTHTFPRAMANARVIKVRKDALDDPEIVSVLIHELGHVVDLGGLESVEYKEFSAFRDGSYLFYADDPSLLFYQISWTEEGRKLHSTNLDFAGGYGAKDMFEDFAECFLLYQKHGKYFRKLAEHNLSLRKKYVFFQYFVFQGKEFDTGEEWYSTDVRYWDITRL